MAKYRIEVDREACMSCELCCAEAPNTFQLDDDGAIRVIDPDGDPPEGILAAAQSCPNAAIVLYDAETGEKVWPED